MLPFICINQMLTGFNHAEQNAYYSFSSWQHTPTATLTCEEGSVVFIGYGEIIIYKTLVFS